jgi:hypothetical protein
VSPVAPTTLTFEQLADHARRELREDFEALTAPGSDIGPRLYAWSSAGLIARPIPTRMFHSAEHQQYLFHRAIPLLVELVKVTLIAISHTIYQRTLPTPFEHMTAREREELIAGKVPRGWPPREEWASKEQILLVLLDGSREQSWFADIQRRPAAKPLLGEWITYSEHSELRGMTETISAALR